MTLLFPFADYWWFYLVFVLFILLFLALDLGVFHRTAHEVSLKEAGIWCVVWIGMALLFNVGFYYYLEHKFTHHPELITHAGNAPAEEAWLYALEFLTGYVVEKSLSVDNVFVFVVIFSFFGIPAKYQHRILFYGILGALIFRSIFIAIGAALMSYHAVVVLFGIFLIITGIKVFFAPEKPLEPEKNPLIKLLRRFLPVTQGLHGQKFFVRENGVFHATPLLLTLVFVEASDIIFAVDSVPAIFAITREPLIVFTSNIFAILGLRALYFLLAHMMHHFSLLKYGLGIILCFVGLKMVWLDHAWGGKFPIGWSLAFIGSVLTVTGILSLWCNLRKATR